MTTDEGIHTHINALVTEEQDIRARLSAGNLSQGDEHSRLTALEVQLDQAWDLLRQRKALRETGGSPDDATERTPDVVENYLE